MGDDWPGGHAISEKIAFRQRLAGRLMKHVPPAADAGQDEEHNQAQRSHSSTSVNMQGCRVSRKLQVSCRSNFGSAASMQRKKRSIEARLNSGTLKTG